MKAQCIELDVDYVGSQDPADQPTAEELAALSGYFQEQKQRRAVEGTQQQNLHNQEEVPKKAA